jgi:tRNA pseudouridine55 synthase
VCGDGCQPIEGRGTLRTSSSSWRRCGRNPLAPHRRTHHRMMRDSAGPDGLLLVDKPAGVTSHDVVLAARRAFGVSRIGHAGTLDPFATGLLVLLLGRATRLLPYLDGVPKLYEATIALGSETDTDDLLGAVVREAPPPSDNAIRLAIGKLTGTIEQMPPAYSAKRVAGRRAYDAARAGEALELTPVKVEVFEWRKVRREGDRLFAAISCGGGTYIRALARDLGNLTGSAAHLAALRRKRSGPFDVRDASTLEELQSNKARLQPALAALPTIPHVTLDGESAERVLRGMPIERSRIEPAAALVDGRSGALVAYAEGDGDRWQPRVVMRKVG